MSEESAEHPESRALAHRMEQRKLIFISLPVDYYCSHICGVLDWPPCKAHAERGFVVAVGFDNGVLGAVEYSKKIVVVFLK